MFVLFVNALSFLEFRYIENKFPFLYISSYSFHDDWIMWNVK
jgi:hypothetical protein